MPALEGATRCAHHTRHPLADLIRSPCVLIGSRYPKDLGALACSLLNRELDLFVTGFKAIATTNPSGIAHPSRYPTRGPRRDTLADNRPLRHRNDTVLPSLQLIYGVGAFRSEFLLGEQAVTAQIGK